MSKLKDTKIDKELWGGQLRLPQVNLMILA